MAHPGTDLPRPPRVVEAGSLRVEEGRPVQEVRQPVGQVLAGREVADPDLHLVLPAVADGVHEQVAVRREVADAHARGAVGVDVERVDDHLEIAARVDRVALGLLGRGAAVDGGHLAVRRAEGEVLEVAGAAGEERPGHVHQLAQARLQALAQRSVADNALGVGVLLGDPGARLRAVLVLEPAVVVGDRDAVEGVDDGIAGGVGRGAGRGSRRRGVRRRRTASGLRVWRVAHDRSATDSVSGVAAPKDPRDTTW